MNLRDILRHASPDVRDLNAELLDDRPPTRQNTATSEDEEQIRLYQVLKHLIQAYPELRLLFHVPNGGYSAAVVDRRTAATGV